MNYREKEDTNMDFLCVFIIFFGCTIYSNSVALEEARNSNTNIGILYEKEHRFSLFLVLFNYFSKPMIV